MWEKNFATCKVVSTLIDWNSTRSSIGVFFFKASQWLYKLKKIMEGKLIFKN